MVVSNLHRAYFRHIMRSTYGKMTYAYTVRILSKNSVRISHVRSHVAAEDFQPDILSRSVL